MDTPAARAGVWFCFKAVLRAGVGRGEMRCEGGAEHLVNEKFPVRKTQLAVSVLPLN